MKILIFDKQVRRNLDLFKHLIKRQADGTKKYFQVAKKSYVGYVNCKTGELRFSALDEKKQYPKKEWKKIKIQLRPDESGAFEALSMEDESGFDCSNLEKMAYEIFIHTIQMLNQLSYDPKHVKNPFWILRQVSQIEFLLSSDEEGQQNFIENCWHQVNRIQAEYLLSDMPPGTFLFREDEYTLILEDLLNRNFSEPVRGYTLTYKDWEEKITEKIVVFKSGDWFFYNDDPTLSGVHYENVSKLLSSLGSFLLKPLLAA